VSAGESSAHDSGSFGALAEPQTLLLQACLLDGDRASSAWAEWLRSTEDPVEFIRCDNSGIRRLLPLLYHASRNFDTQIDGMLGTCLRAAHMREQLRMKIYLEILWLVVDALSDQAIEAIFLNGSALAGTVYPRPEMRHCHDIDILIDRAEWARAISVLEAAGLLLTGQDDQTVQLEHASQLPIKLHGDLRYQQQARTGFEEVFAGRFEHSIEARTFQTLSSSQMFLQISAGLPGRPEVSPIQLSCDAWHVVNSAAELDSGDLMAQADRYGVGSQGRMMLEYLENELVTPLVQ